MALVKFGTGVSVLSGKSGGVVYARNRAGAYQRKWTKPISPGSAAQVESRARMSTLSNDWRALSTTDQDAWNLYAAGSPTVNRLGDTILLSGINCYTALNALRLQAVQALRSTAPAAVGFAPTPTALLSQLVLDATAGTFDPSVATIFLGNANARGFVQLSPAVSPGVRFYKGPWIESAQQAGPAWAAGTGLPLTTMMAAGEFRWVRLRQYDQDGRISSASIYGPIIVTEP